MLISLHNYKHSYKTHWLPGCQCKSFKFLFTFMSFMFSPNCISVNTKPAFIRPSPIWTSNINESLHSFLNVLKFLYVLSVIFHCVHVVFPPRTWFIHADGVIPGLLNPAIIPCAHVLGDVTQRAVNAGEIGPAHVQEVRTQAAHRHLGDVCEGLTDGASKEEHPDLFVEGRQVRVPHKCVGALMEEVDPVALTYGDLYVVEIKVKR